MFGKCSSLIEKGQLRKDNFLSLESFLNFRAVSENTKHRIEQLLIDVSQFNGNDILVNCQQGIFPVDAGQSSFLFPYEQHLKALLQSAIRTKKEQGIFPLCLAKGLVEWSYKGERIHTPILLFPCTIELIKVSNAVKINVLDDEVFVNPFLLNRLQAEFEFKKELLSVDEIEAFLKANDFSILQNIPSFLGNFHHHRFEIVKELEELLECSLSSSVSELLGDEHLSSNVPLKLGNELLFPSDANQLEVFSCFELQNTVVQGPPGTGKSQVLSNLLGKVLSLNASAVVVSEKRVALEVLVKKLAQFDLDSLCFIATSETLSKDFLAELKLAWNQMEASNLKFSEGNLLISEQYRDQLQYTLDVLNRPDLIGGVSYSDYQSLLAKRPIDQYTYSSDLPDVSELLKNKTVLERIYSTKLNSLIGSCSYGSIQQVTFLKLDKAISSWKNELTELKKLFVIETWSDFQEAMKLAAMSQNFSNPIVRKHSSILKEGSKEQKRFEKLRKQYLKTEYQLATFQSERTNWKKEPTNVEVDYLLELLGYTSLIGKWKVKRHWSNYSNLPLEKANDLLHHWKQYLNLNNSLSHLKVELCEIGIDELPLELELIQQQIHHTSADERAKWEQISPELRLNYANENGRLNQLYTELKATFRWDETESIGNFLDAFLNHFQDISNLHVELKKLPEVFIRSCKRYASFEEIELSIFKSSWVRFSHQFPTLSSFEPNDLLGKSKRILEERSNEAVYLASSIQHKQLEKFQMYHELLQTVPAKLSAEEKELRARLKKGKALLVKEFAKSRNHPSLRELFASDAREWIQLFKPIWLSNPAQIAKCFPMQEGLFDVAIFDEASQIPLQNVLGTLQRSKRILVAGDQQQMGPSWYFKSGSTEIIDVLHQASFYWNTVSLKHHYRSEHPALIQFSNKHFYKNELVAFPSVQQELQPIMWHYCEKGRFINRKNQEEAKQVAVLIEKVIDSANVLGIVAFSESQLAEINGHLSSKTLEKLEERIENDTAFFKALENVQGEECDLLIISFGYGYSEENEFHMRFGPMNSKNGTKRLNVLLTRACKKIDFFSSVKASDFKLSSNEAINLLRQFLLQLENATTTDNSDFPFGLTPQISSNQLTIEHVYEKMHDAEEVLTLVSVLENRGWELNFS